MSVLHPTTLLTGDAYARDLARAIRRAKSRVVLLTTTLRDDDPRSHDIIEALIVAADQGVEISVCADTFTYLEPKEFFLHSPKRQPARAMQALKLERKLKKHGVSFHWLGRKTNLTFSGRTHAKWSVVDDTVYTFGGVNLDNDSFNNADFVLKLRDAALADHLAGEQARIRKIDRGGGALRSHQFRINPQSVALIDGGIPLDSLIYRRACTLARQARDVTLISQYCPTGPLNRLLKRVDATLYFNHWKKASWVNRVLIQMGTFTAKQQTNYTRHHYLHAKFMLFTMHDGSQAALSGSHNFMFGSGALGTREIALETTDKKIIAQLRAFYERHVV